jgi:hypothetical protein
VLHRSVPILIASTASLAASACDSARAGSQTGAAAVSQDASDALIDGAAAGVPLPIEPVTEGAAELPPTGLPLTLLATLSGPEGRATIRDDDEGVIATYRPGETLRPDVFVVAIDEDGVTLDEDGATFRLPFDPEATELRPDDVFYPDLVRYDDLPHSMADAVQLGDGEGWVVKHAAYAWGTPRTVAAIREALHRYGRAHPDAPDVYVGDLSKKDGGPFPPHLSHQSGRDVDIGLVHSGRHAGARGFFKANLDLERTWALLSALLDTGQVAYVFVDYHVQARLYEWAAAHDVSPALLESRFQYPHGRTAAHGIVRHWKGHADHLHVRFRE